MFFVDAEEADGEVVEEEEYSEDEQNEDAQLEEQQEETEEYHMAEEVKFYISFFRSHSLFLHPCIYVSTHLSVRRSSRLSIHRLSYASPPIHPLSHTLHSIDVFVCTTISPSSASRGCALRTN